MNTMEEHWRKCEGAICKDDPTPDWKKNVVWYPGEPLCQKGPYSRWQKNQSKINRYLKKGRLTHPRTCYTAEMLERRNRVNVGVRGMNPEMQGKHPTGGMK